MAGLAGPHVHGLRGADFLGGLARAVGLRLMPLMSWSCDVCELIAGMDDEPIAMQPAFLAHPKPQFWRLLAAIPSHPPNLRHF